MTVYEQLINAAEQGKSVLINLNTKSARINGKQIVKDGVYDGDYGITLDKPKEMVEFLFENYFYSYPSTKGCKKKSFFIAQKFEKLTNKQLATGEDRVVAQVKLEAYILGLILLGCPFSAFDTDEKHWFWQSPNNKKLIIQREWFSKE